jgi:hypothetical protein
MDKTEKLGLVIDMFHRIMVHHVFWFKEVEHQMGFEKAMELLHEVWDADRANQMTRLGKTLGFEVDSELAVPAALTRASEEEIDGFLSALAANWIAQDGIWFQAIEKRYGMNEAKRSNDSCWAWFSPFEAASIKKLLGLDEHPGLEGLKKALGYRMYAVVNKQSIIEESPDQVVFRMDDCRVQSARKRKNMPDYPCKSAGLVEYSRFAEAIDSRIKTQCICCPPDNHPEDSYCCWRFSIEG